MIEINDLITLSDDKKYIVISKSILKDNTYIFIIEEANLKNCKILKVEIENNATKLSVVSNTKLLAKLSVIFIKQVKEKMNQD